MVEKVIGYCITQVMPPFDLSGRGELLRWVVSQLRGLMSRVKSTPIYASYAKAS